MFASCEVCLQQPLGFKQRSWISDYSQSRLPLLFLYSSAGITDPLRCPMTSKPFSLRSTCSGQHAIKLLMCDVLHVCCVGLFFLSLPLPHISFSSITQPAPSRGSTPIKREFCLFLLFARESTLGFCTVPGDKIHLIRHCANKAELDSLYFSLT